MLIVTHRVLCIPHALVINFMHHFLFSSQFLTQMMAFLFYDCVTVFFVYVREILKNFQSF